MKDFIGAWRLVTVEDQKPDGGPSYPYGDDPEGLLMYDESGYMSVQIMQRDRDPDSMLEGFTAFFGTYDVDEQRKIVTHRVHGHVLPESVGKELKRSYEFSGSRLILRPSATRKVIWERIQDLGFRIQGL